MGGRRASELTTNEKERGVSEFESVSCDLRLRVRAANVCELRSTVLRAELSKVRCSLSLVQGSLSLLARLYLLLSMPMPMEHGARQSQSSARGECAALFLEVHFGGKTSHRMNNESCIMLCKVK